jgi:hypothetical protein
LRIGSSRHGWGKARPYGTGSGGQIEAFGEAFETNSRTAGAVNINPLTIGFPNRIRICAELGLRDLLARMPGGLLQIVGKRGWRLSHGERSRLYIARVLLEGRDIYK